MPYFKSMPADSTVPDILKFNPEAGATLMELNEAIMRRPSPLSEEARELIAAYVSGLNSCQYCFGVHSHTAMAYGVEEGLFESLMDDVDAAPVDEKLKPILRFVKKLTEAPARLTQADADAVWAAGWDEQALHDAISVACMFNFMNRLLEGHGVKGSTATFESRGPMLKEKGYASLIPMLRDAALEKTKTPLGGDAK